MTKSKAFLILILAVLSFGAVFSLVETAIKSREPYKPLVDSKSEKGTFSFIEDFFGKRDINKPYSAVYGFLPYWSLSEAKYIDYQVLTDISYFALYIDGKGNIIKILDDGTTEPGYLAWSKGNTINEVIAKAKENNVRMSLTIAAHDNVYIEDLLNCNACWYTLVDNIGKELDAKGIGSANLDFEYLGVPPFQLDARYTNLVAFVSNELKRKNPNSKVTVSTFADSFKKVRITNVPQLAKVSDALFIMAYDFYQPTSDNAGPIAPVGGFPNKYDYDLTTMLADYKKAAPANKLIMGVPYYGYNWIVESNNPNAKRIPGSDLIGHTISQNYDQIQSSPYLKDVKWDDEAKSPYFTYFSPDGGTYREVYFENAESLKGKYDLAKKEGLLGIGIWALGYDGDRKELWNLLREEFLPL